MSRLDVQFLDRGFHRVMFDAMPLPVFVVDADVTVLEYNAAAARLVGQARRTVLRRRGGDILHCVHATEVPGGCGRAPACVDCVLRHAVTAAAAGKRVTRRWARLEQLTGGKRNKVDLRVTCQPFNYGGFSFILLILEGLAD